MYPRFGLTLMVTRRCNMACAYCYVGPKSSETLPEAVGRKAIDRALSSLSPDGTLELGFFGGEPLIEAEMVGRLMDYARDASLARGNRLRCTLTTNGTVASSDALALMTRDDLDLVVSCDGMPQTHDRNRRFADGSASSARVERTLQRLRASGKQFRISLVVTPNNVDDLADGIDYLARAGTRSIDPTLDLWAEWSSDDMRQLDHAVRGAARVWCRLLPEVSVGWFDEKVARLTRAALLPTSRCSFGAGEIAVAPSGNLYPCERLIGTDDDNNPMRLTGSALEGNDFLDYTAPELQPTPECAVCSVASMCNTTCRCSNYTRTGNVAAPDRLLCLLNTACMRHAAEALAEASSAVDAAGVTSGGVEQCSTRKTTGCRAQRRRASRWKRSKRSFWRSCPSRPGRASSILSRPSRS